MAAHEKTIEQLLQLSQRTERGSRADGMARALHTAILLVDADAAVIVTASGRRRGERLVQYAGSDTPASLPLTLSASAVLAALAEKRQVISLSDLSDEPSFAAADTCPGVEAGPVLFVPVEQRDGHPAYLAAYRKRGRAKHTAIETELLLLLASWLGTTLDHARLAAGNERLAITDDAIEIYNARFVKSALKRELRRANRYAQELSFLAVEIDGQASFRESHGPAATSRLVKDVATLLAGQVRAFDLLGRDGDDSFMVVLPQTNHEGAMEVAERMRAAIESATFAPASAGQVTATIGVSTFPHDGIEPEAMLSVAERALEQGRLKGGNCVTNGARRAA